jgi:hypothetical protein
MALTEASGKTSQFTTPTTMTTINTLSIHRFYPCQHSSKHRTALVSKNGVRDVTLNVSFPSVQDWDDSCCGWEECEHEECIIFTFVDGRNAIDQAECARKKEEKAAEKAEKAHAKAIARQVRYNAKIAKKIAKRELVRQKNAAKFEALYIMRAEKAKKAQKK